LAAHVVIRTLVRLLVVTTLAVPGFAGNRFSSAEHGPLRAESFTDRTPIGGVPVHARVRWDAPEDNDSSEACESDVACLTPDVSGAVVRLRVADASPLFPESLPASQDSPGPGFSRAPPLL
jgi:hypothetical protein